MNRVRLFDTTGIALDLERDTHRIVALAEDVAIERAIEVCIAMYHMAAARSLFSGPPYGAGAPITCTAAAVQDKSATKDYQAAHLLPGSIRVAGRLVWDIVPESSSALVRLSAQLEWSFARTIVLPAAVNRADSAGERDLAHEQLGGLKHRFALRVQELWNGAPTVTGKTKGHALAPLTAKGGSGFSVDRGAVHAALGGWFRDLGAVYSSAALTKRRAAAEATTKDARLRRRTEAKVLETYAGSFSVVNVGRFVESHLRPVVDAYR